MSIANDFKSFIIEYNKIEHNNVNQLDEWSKRLAICFHNHILAESKIKEEVNKNVTLLSTNGKAREIYNSLVDKLIEGYQYIINNANQNAKISELQLFGEKVFGCFYNLEGSDENSVSAFDFSNKAIEVIEFELRDPFTYAYNSIFKYQDGKSNPVIKHILLRLTEAKLNLNIHLAQAFGNNISNDSTFKSSWDLTYGKLSDTLNSQSLTKTIPWFWLGVNSLRCLNLFRSIDVSNILTFLDKSQARALSLHIGILCEGEHFKNKKYYELIFESLESATEKLPDLESKKHKIDEKRDESLLINMLYEHHLAKHKQKPLTQDIMAKKLNWSQTRVSRVIKNVFGGMKSYNASFVDGTVIEHIQKYYDAAVS